MTVAVLGVALIATPSCSRGNHRLPNRLAGTTRTIHGTALERLRKRLPSAANHAIDAANTHPRVATPNAISMVREFEGVTRMSSTVYVSNDASRTFIDVANVGSRSLQFNMICARNGILSACQGRYQTLR